MPGGNDDKREAAASVYISSINRNLFNPEASIKALRNKKQNNLSKVFKQTQES